MPLTENIRFKAVLQKGNRIQVPRLIRWQFKMGPSQTLKVTVRPMGLGFKEEEFYARMSKDGRIRIPKLTLKLLQEENESIVGSVLEVSLKPVKP